MNPDALRQEINRLILHPLGLTLEELLVSRATPHTYIENPDPEFARQVADEIENLGSDRVAALGYVVQPLDPEVKQLKVSVLEHVQWNEKGDPQPDGPDPHVPERIG